jgi:hypothetical protein
MAFNIVQVAALRYRQALVVDWVANSLRTDALEKKVESI